MPTGAWVPDPDWPAPPAMWEWWHCDPPLEEGAGEEAGRRHLQLEEQDGTEWWKFSEPDLPMVWVAPPGWPPAPRGWHPPTDWVADPRWPDPPLGWQFWQKEPVSLERARRAWWATVVASSGERIASDEATYWELRLVENHARAASVIPGRVLDVDSWAADVNAVPPMDAPSRLAVIAARDDHLRALSEQRVFLTRESRDANSADLYARLRVAAAEAHSASLNAVMRWILHCVDLYRSNGGELAAEYRERLLHRWLDAFKAAHHLDEMLATYGTPPERDVLNPDHSSAWALAEQVAAVTLQVLGFPDARATPVGADGGFDVEGRGIVAQVKYLTRPVGRPELQRLAGANQHGAQAAFFSRAGYAAQAVAFADAVGMALFTLELPDNVQPVNDVARRWTAALPPA